MSGELFYGDNLEILRRHIADGSVDLVYLDPPFNSNAKYSLLFSDPDGTKASSQIQAFEDTWHWDTAAAAALEGVVVSGGEPADAMVALQKLLGPSTMLAYLAMMAPRLIELKRVLKSEGSIYLHCDPTASHYLKMLMDAIFGPANFVNEIVWRRYGTHNDAGQGSRHYGRVHDVILYYINGKKAYWDQQYVPLSEEYIEKTYRMVEPETGRRFTTKPLTAPGGAAKGNPSYEWNGHTRFWRYSEETMKKLDEDNRLHYSKTGYARQKQYLDESKGVPVQDLWDDIPSLVGSNAERLGYPTQKPLDLMRRIIETSCPDDGVVLDPFCGCGTTIIAAEELGRDWIGIDITNLAVTLMKSRLNELGATDFKTVGEPQSAEDAADLAADDPYQFQWWALGLIGARPVEEKKGADKGIDGQIYFYDGGPNPRQLIASVKAGKVTVSHLRDLRGVLDREKAEVGVLVSLNEPTGPMKKEAASAGFYKSPYGSHPRIQLITVAELLDGKTLDLPPEAFQKVNVAVDKSGQGKNPDQMTLNSDDDQA